MIHQKRLYSVLIVSAVSKFNESIISLLPESKYSPVTCVGSIAAAKREVLERDYDIILINSPLTDDFGTQFAIAAVSDSSSVVLIFVKSEQYADVYGKTAEHGVLTLKKPTSPQMVSQLLDFMRAARERLRLLQKKAISVEEKMDEIRTVNRAKWLLIENLKMTEPDAHRYIEKQAMDRCVTKREVAENILRTYK